jgi:hypothetical protein
MRLWTKYSHKRMRLCKENSLHKRMRL